MSITILSLSLILRRHFFPYLPLLCLVASLALVPSLLDAQNEDDFARARREMIERDLRPRGIKDQRVLKAMGAVPRHLFVPEKQRPAAYEDRALAIGEDQTISQPYVVALMSQLAGLKGKERVLEVGTGSGYQAAVLSCLAADVYTIEIISSLADRARAIFSRLGYDNVWVKTGDGFFGWEEKAPFDVILVTASAEKIPDRLWQQLREGGRLIMPLGPERQNQILIRATKISGKPSVEKITDVIFVPMTGAVKTENR
ncbi:MAG: protein-L-isoaspartate(D-aspartate) O-methyltransferase [Deltaproteobacteria bacterium]|nr:protein-L-isoaspartate(D-aspartate) O-methyltransferase [Deltaproteobacteria bacterium]